MRVDSLGPPVLSRAFDPVIIEGKLWNFSMIILAKYFDEFQPSGPNQRRNQYRQVVPLTFTQVTRSSDAEKQKTSPDRTTDRGSFSLRAKTSGTGSHAVVTSG